MDEKSSLGHRDDATGKRHRQGIRPLADSRLLDAGADAIGHGELRTERVGFWSRTVYPHDNRGLG